MSSNSTTKRDTARKPPSKHRPTKAEMEGVMAIDATLDRLAGAAPADGAARRQPKRTESDAARIRLRVPRGSRDRTRDGVSRREQRSGARNVRALCKPGRGVERHRHRSPCGTGSSRPGPIRQGTQVYRPLHESLSIASSPARGARPGCRAQACRIPPRWLPRRMRFSRNNALVPALPLPPGIRSDRQVPSRSRPRDSRSRCRIRTLSGISGCRIVSNREPVRSLPSRSRGNPWGRSVAAHRSGAQFRQSERHSRGARSGNLTPGLRCVFRARAPMSRRYSRRRASGEEHGSAARSRSTHASCASRSQRQGPGATSTVLWQSYAASLMRSARSRSRAARRGAGPGGGLVPDREGGTAPIQPGFHRDVAETVAVERRLHDR